MDRSEFLRAVENGDVDVVRDALAADPSLATTPSARAPSALLAALYRSHGELVSLLREHATPTLAEATALGDLDRVRALLAEDPRQIHERTADGWMPLHLAAFFGRAKVAKVLIDAGASPGEDAVSGNEMANFPLHAAIAGAQDAETIGTLLDAGADVNATAALGITPLHLAASRGNLQLIGTLLARGGNSALEMDSGQTPADMARERGHPEAANRLDA